MGTFLGNIQKLNSGGSAQTMGAFVVYDLPNRDCAASASHGEYSVAGDGLTKYKAYIDAIKTQLGQYPDVPVALIIEPDSLGNLVTNLQTPNCTAAADAYKEGIAYAIKTLDQPNVAQYLDAGHAGWLGWPANIAPAAQLFAEVYKAGGSPKSVRGLAAVRCLATNVANYNAFSTTSCPSYTQGSKVCDEKTYINNLAPLLQQNGFPAHFIIDTGESSLCRLISIIDSPLLNYPYRPQRQAAHWAAAMGRLVQRQRRRLRRAPDHRDRRPAGRRLRLGQARRRERRHEQRHGAALRPALRLAGLAAARAAGGQLVRGLLRAARDERQPGLLMRCALLCGLQESVGIGCIQIQVDADDSIRLFSPILYVRFRVVRISWTKTTRLLIPRRLPVVSTTLPVLWLPMSDRQSRMKVHEIRLTPPFDKHFDRRHIHSISLVTVLRSTWPGPSTSRASVNSGDSTRRQWRRSAVSRIW